jgi:hypothetical protein
MSTFLIATVERNEGGYFWVTIMLSKLCKKKQGGVVYSFVENNPS